MISKIRKTEWQPIETAPKDGTPVLGFGEIIYPHGTAWQAVVEFDEPNWFVQCDGYGHGDADCSRLTHWMPLPDAPKSAVRKTRKLQCVGGPIESIGVIG